MQLLEVRPSLKFAVEVASLGFSRSESQGLIDDVSQHLDSGKLVYTIESEGAPIGFAIFAIYDDVLYLSGIIIIPELQGKGFGPEIFRAVSKRFPECRYLAMRTQSLRMFVAASKVCGEYYPTLDNQPIPDEFSFKGIMVAAMIESHFPFHYGCYNGALYGEKPIYKDDQQQCLWDSLCNFDRGDAVLFIGRIA